MSTPTEYQRVAAELAALRADITALAGAYLRSWQRRAGASTLDTDVAQMLRNLLGDV